MEIAELVLKYIEALIWPAVTIFILLYFRDELSKLFDRAKKVELPGGISIETFEDKLEEAKLLEKEVRSERKPETKLYLKRESKKKSDANKRMIDLGLRPSPSGLDMNYYREIAKSDKKIAMAGLRMDLELMIRNLASGFGIKVDNKEPAQSIINKLIKTNSITTTQAEFIRAIFDLANYAIHGGEVSKDQFESVIELGDTLVEDYIAWLDWGFKKQL
jgi:hypothetical protein